MSTSSILHSTYSFGEFTLDLDRGALVEAGADVKLRPKSFEMLCHLVERHGLLVTKDELLDAIWGNTVVTEGAITQCIKDIRSALRDKSQKKILQFRDADLSSTCRSQRIILRSQIRMLPLARSSH